MSENPLKACVTSIQMPVEAKRRMVQTLATAGTEKARFCPSVENTRRRTFTCLVLLLFRPGACGKHRPSLSAHVPFFTGHSAVFPARCKKRCVKRH